MKRHAPPLRILCALLLILPSVAPGLYAAAPALMTYQGRLKERGLPVTGSRSIDLSICDALSGGSCTSVGAQTVSVSNGLFAMTFAPPFDLSGGAWYLQVAVAGTPLTPRERLTAAPYAIFASTAATVVAGSIDSTKLVAGAVDTSKLANDSVTFSKIAGSGCSNGEVIKWSAGAWGCGTDNTNAGSISLGTGKIFVGDVSNLAQPQTVSGDASLSPSGVLAISNSAIDTVKLAADAIITAKISDGAIQTAKLANDAVTFAKLAGGGCSNGQVLGWNGSSWGCSAAGGPPSGSAGGDLTGTYPNPAIAAGRVDTGKLAADAVDSTKIADGSVNTAELATDAVTAAKILNLAVTNAKIAVLAVDTAKLAADAVVTAKISDGAVQTAKLANDAVTFAKIAGGGCSNGQVLGWNGSSWGCSAAGGPPSGSAGGDLTGTYPNPAIAAGRVDTGKLAADAVDSTKIADGSVNTAELATDAVTAAKILNLAVTNAKIAALAVDTAKLAVDAVTTAKILDANVTNAKLANSAVDTGKLANDAVTFSKIAGGGCSNGQVIGWNGSAWACAPAGGPPSGSAGGDLTGTYPNPAIAAGKIDTGKLAADAVDSTKIADGAVNTSKIVSGAIDTTKILDAAVTPAKLDRPYVQLAPVSQQSVATGRNLIDVIYTGGADFMKFVTTASQPRLELLNSGELDLVMNSGNAAINLGSFSSYTTAMPVRWQRATGSALAPSAAVSGAEMVGLVGQGYDGSAYRDSTWLKSFIDGAPGANNMPGRWAFYTSPGGGAAPQERMRIDSAGNVGIGKTPALGLLDVAGTVAAIGFTGDGAGLTNLTGSAIAVNTIDTTKLQADAVDSTKILSGAVNTVKLAADAVTSSKMSDGAVQTAKLANDAVTFAKIAGNGCTAGQIIKWNGAAWGCAAGATGSTLSTAKIWIGDASNQAQEQAIGGDASLSQTGQLTIANGAINTGKLNSGAVDTTKLNVDAVLARHILSGAVQTAKIAQDAVDSTKILTGAVNTAKLAACANSGALTWINGGWSCQTSVIIGIGTGGGNQTDPGTNPSISVDKIGASGNLLQLRQASNDKFIVDFNGNLQNYGTSPQITLQGDDTGSLFSTVNYYRSKPTIAVDDNLGETRWKALDAGATPRIAARIRGVAESAAGATYVPGRIEFHTSDATGPVERMRITSAGKIAIGYAGPPSWDLSLGNSGAKTIGMEPATSGSGVDLTVTAGAGAASGGTGGALTLQAGSAQGVTGGNGGGLAIRAGNAAGSGPMNGGSILLAPGGPSGSGAPGSVVIQGNGIQPSVSGGGQAALWYDTINQQLKLSQNGGNWAYIGGKQLFATVGTGQSWTPPGGVSTVYVTMCGGGGGGGGGTNGCPNPGGGGGGGAVCMVKFPVTVVPGTPVSLSVGGAGSGGGSPLNGGSGSSSSFGSLTVPGGNGGIAGSVGTGGAFVAPVSGGFDGKAGSNGATPNGGTGATGPFGAGGAGGSSTSVPGSPGSNYGSGGGGGGCLASGASGGQGFVLVEW